LFNKSKVVTYSITSFGHGDDTAFLAVNPRPVARPKAAGSTRLGRSAQVASAEGAMIGVFAAERVMKNDDEIAYFNVR